MQSEPRITQQELASLFPDGVPMPLMKMIFPEKSEKLTVEDIRYILNAMRSEAALSTDAEPVAWIVRNPTVARTHSKTQAHKSSKEALYPVSREEDAREYARLMGGECLPLYAHSLEAEQEENAAEGKCQENDGCPTEKAVLQRFWRRHHNAEPGTVLKNAIRAVSKAFDPSSMLPITENQAQRRAIGSLNRLSALYAEPVKTAPSAAVSREEMAERLFATDWPNDKWDRFKDGDHAKERYLRMADTALSAQVQDVEGWRSMDSAPKDGKHCLLAVRSSCFVYAVQGAFMSGKWENVAGLGSEPLCWMPLTRIPLVHLPWTKEFSAAAPASKHGDAE